MIYNVDELDQLLIEGLSDYIDISNAALKHELAVNPDKFVLAGKLKQTPVEQSPYEIALSYGMTALNEKNGEPLADDIKMEGTLKDLHGRLKQHFLSRTNHGLRSQLAGMGLTYEEKRAFTTDRNNPDPEVLERSADRAADRGVEIFSGRQRVAGYPMTSQQIVGGHGIGRATSVKNEQPEQIMQRNNMQVEGGAEGMVRHEYRGRKAADLANRKFIEYLASDAIDAKTADKVINTLKIIQSLRPRRKK